MNYRVLYTCICLLGALFIAAFPATAIQTNIASPPILRNYVAEIPSADEHFMEQVTEFIEQMSDQTLNVRDDLLFFPLLASGYNIKDHSTAQKLIDFLFYSAKAGEHYQQYRANKERYFTPINPEEEYLLAEEYRSLAEKTFEACESCQEYFPDFVMYTLPSKEDQISDDGYQFTGKLGF
ncbi:MAG: hypothetical protein LBV40_05005 [Methanomicrobiales archaeon]|jgi:hypothetical protein|nr:hypothetical protein [Methanomicrobiales archaeon]